MGCRDTPDWAVINRVNHERDRHIALIEPVNRRETGHIAMDITEIGLARGSWAIRFPRNKSILNILSHIFYKLFKFGSEIGFFILNLQQK